LSLRCQQLEPETAVELSSLDLSIGSGRWQAPMVMPIDSLFLTWLNLRSDWLTH
jgi:hypothetical protein